MLGDRIKKFRLEKGLTQKDLADKLYVTAQAVSRWENNEVEPSVKTITEIAILFDVSVSKLIGEEEQPKVPESSRRKLSKAAKEEEISKMEKGMREAAKMLDFEYAAVLRDRIKRLREELNKR